MLDVGVGVEVAKIFCRERNEGRRSLILRRFGVRGCGVVVLGGVGFRGRLGSWSGGRGGGRSDRAEEDVN